MKNRDLLIASMALYGIITRYEERQDKAFLVDDISVLLDFCDEHDLTDVNIHGSKSIRDLLANLMEKEDLISWLLKENQQ